MHKYAHIPVCTHTHTHKYMLIYDTYRDKYAYIVKSKLSMA